MKPILIDLPQEITTTRLLLRPPMPGDGVVINEAIIESFDDIKEWLPWATHIPTVEETEETTRIRHIKWLNREDLGLLIFDRQTGQYLGGVGFPRMDWYVPKFEVGYWLRSSQVGKGIVSEAVNACVRFAFLELKAKKIELKCDSKNEKSIKVAKSLGFNLEAHLKLDSMTPDKKEIRDLLIFTRYNLENLPSLEVNWT